MPRKHQEPDSVIEITTVEGLRVPAQRRQAWVHSTRVFEPVVPGWHAGQAMPATCGSMFDAAAAVIESEPPFLSRPACDRHLSFLEHLCRATYESIKRGQPLTGPLRSDRVGRLNIVLEMWVEYFLHSQETHPLAASWALDTAVILMDLVAGARRDTLERDSWELRGLAADRKPAVDWREDRIDSPQMKREISQRLGGTLAVARVPEGGRIYSWSRNEHGLFGPGDLVVVQIARCHLSRGVADYHHFACTDPLKPAYDLDDEFCFLSGILPFRISLPSQGSCRVVLIEDPSTNAALYIPRGYLPMGDLPGDWIIGTLDEPPGEPAARFVPLPWRRDLA